MVTMFAMGQYHVGVISQRDCAIIRAESTCSVSFMVFVGYLPLDSIINGESDAYNSRGTL